MSNASSKPSSTHQENGAQGPIKQLFTRWPKASKSHPVNFGSPLRVVLTVAAIFISSQILALLTIESVLAIRTGTFSPFERSALAQFGYFLIAQGLAAAWVLAILNRRRMSLDAIGFGRRLAWGDVWRAVAGFGVFYAILIVVAVLLKQFLPAIDLEQAQDVGFNYLNTHADKVLAFTALVILPPIGEEILMRGYLYSGLRRHWRFLPSLIITGVLFGGAHLQWGSGSELLWAAGIHTFILSGVLVYLREKTGALYSSILVHGFNNLLAFIVYFN
jgi:membrane protease YdiL (CAAX protease family)